ncbi:DNA polymerase III subunit gamma/tau, partial [Oleiphilus sp. HI0061]
MSYQVLARKWRPQNFKQMVGQEHVLKALIHALESQRLHHAYLFTGTRGVGKTTIGRILAKCLSCHQGITAEPCGQCGACTSITEGRYVDLIEIDAASRTKVEDMRELLENVQYAPSEGRFKIYLIDEVHMLSQSSFNALLKTLEEPPEHVKFLFATTDPQKLPVTILSRCLQFNLKNMSPERIVGHLQNILGQEQVSFEDMALWALARAADGSMRDALSLTDQAIAYGNHALTETGVSAMLGTVDQKKIYRILDCLISRNAAAMLDEIKALAEFSPNYASVLATIAEVLHRVAIEQAVPGACDNSMGDQEHVVSYARKLCAEDVQLFYQVALVSRQ